MNIKQLLIEKERVAYIENKPALAKFFNDVLEYVVALEEQVNRQDARIEELEAQVLEN